jgi:hypothetical protein
MAIDEPVRAMWPDGEMKQPALDGQAGSVPEEPADVAIRRDEMYRAQLALLKRKQPRSWKSFVGPVLLLLLVGGCVYGVIDNSLQNRNDLAEAKAGDCVRDIGKGRHPYQRIACTDQAAQFKVFGIVADTADCNDVAGASTLVGDGDGHLVCLGAKDVDQAKAINVAKVGDCVSLAHAEPQRADCASAEADHKVLKRLERVLSSQLGTVCQTVDGSDQSYSWDWKRAQAEQRFDNMIVDVVLCFGPK